MLKPLCTRTLAKTFLLLAKPYHIVLGRQMNTDLRYAAVFVLITFVRPQKLAFKYHTAFEGIGHSFPPNLTQNPPPAFFSLVESKEEERVSEER